MTLPALQARSAYPIAPCLFFASRLTGWKRVWLSASHVGFDASCCGTGRHLGVALFVPRHHAAVLCLWHPVPNQSSEGPAYQPRNGKVKSGGHGHFPGLCNSLGADL